MYMDCMGVSRGAEYVCKLRFEEMFCKMYYMLLDS